MPWGTFWILVQLGKSFPKACSIKEQIGGNLDLIKM